jgi:hypothetical protein
MPPQAMVKKRNKRPRATSSPLGGTPRDTMPMPTIRSQIVVRTKAGVNNPARNLPKRSASR